MATIFSRVMAGEIPSRMIWEDERCVAFLDVRPLAPGHCLVVPRDEIDQWTDLDADTAAHLMTVAHTIGKVQKRLFSPARVGLMIAGFEVPHVHVHVVPIDHIGHLDFSNADSNPDQAALDSQQARLRDGLAAEGAGGR